MAEFIEVIKQKKRMCESMASTNKCRECGLDVNKNGKNVGCAGLVTLYPQEAEKIIMDWAKENPVMTNADKFKEVFGVELAFESSHCIGFGCGQKRIHCGDCEYYEFWNKEYVEPKENEDGKRRLNG